MLLVLGANPVWGDNSPPDANAGEDITRAPGYDQVLKNDLITLNGSASTDEDITGCIWAWSCSSHTDIVLEGSSSPRPSFTVSVGEGTLKFKLVLTDPEGLSDTDEVWVMVTPNSRPIPVMLSPAPSPPSYHRSQEILFSANSSSDPEGRPLSYSWTDEVSGQPSTQLSTQRYFSRKLDALGPHRITLNASDLNGGWSLVTSDITIREDPMPPTAAFEVLPRRSDLTYKKSETIRFDASLTTDPNTDESLNFTWSTNVSGGRVLGHGLYLNRTLEEGRHNITLTVTDKDLLSDSGSVIIDVENTQPLARISAPEVRSRGSKPTVNVTDVVRFLGSASTDADGDDLEFLWDFGDGAIGIGEDVQHAFMDWGSLTITLTVDDGSSTNRYSIAQFALSINTVPVAVIEAPSVVTMGEAFELTANGSVDEDGDPLSYLWDMDGDGSTDTQGFSVVHIFSEEGPHTVTLTVSDGFAESKASFIIEAAYPNERPVAKIMDYDSVLNRTVIVPLDEGRGSAELDASPSYDPDDDTNGNGIIDGKERSNLTYSWDTDAEKDADGDGDTDNDEERTGKTLRLTISGTSTLRVVLFVRDRRGATDRLELRLRGDHPPRVTDIRTDPSSTLLVNGSVKFTIQASDDDRSDLRVLKYDLDFGDGQSMKGSVTNEFSHTYLGPGNYEVRANVTDGSLFVVYTTTLKVVKLLPPEVRFPPSGTKLSGTIIVKGSLQAPPGWTVKMVEVDIDGKGWEDADGTDSWEFDLITSRLSKGKHTLTVRGTVKAGTTEVASEGTITFFVTEPQAEGTNFVPIVAGALIILVVIIVLYFLVFRRKKGTDRMEDLMGPPPVEGMAPPAMQPQFRPPAPPAVSSSSLSGALSPGALAPTLQQVKMPPPAPQVRKVKVKCPACGKLFTEQDSGERPLHTVCKHCGAKGSIDSLPWDETRPGIEAPEAPREGPEPVPIVCPSCGELFELKGPVSEAKCPSCGAEGELDQDTQEKLKEAYDKVKELTLKCPKCSGMFHVKQGGQDIICPYCGTKGKLPR